MATFTGSWDVTINTPIGKIETVFKIAEEGGSFSGVASTDKEAVTFYDIVVDGDKMKWLQDVTTPMKLTLKFEVVVSGNDMVGTSKAGMFPASKLQGTRVPTT